MLINPVAEPDGARQGGRLVLPLPQGQDRLRQPAARVAALLGQVRASTTTTATRISGGSTLTRACTGISSSATRRGPRPARVDPAALHLERHRALQREPRSDRASASGTRSPSTRCHADRARHARRVDLGLRRRLRATTSWTRSHATTTRIGRGYETFGNGTAETVERTLDPERNQFTGHAVTDPDWYRMAPRQEVPLVAAQQHQLPGERGAGGAAVHGAQLAGNDAQLLGGARRTRCARARTRSRTRSRSPRSSSTCAASPASST